MYGIDFYFEAAGEDLTFHIHNSFVDLRVNWRLRCTFSLTNYLHMGVLPRNKPWCLPELAKINQP